jgi:hypothetical protein
VASSTESGETPMHWGHCGRVMARPRLQFAADYGGAYVRDPEGDKLRLVTRT